MYQCNKCGKTYTKEELINYLIEVHKIDTLKPVCPECKSTDFTQWTIIKK